MTHAEIIAEMRFHGQQNIDAEKDKPEYGILTVEGRIAQNYADRLEAAHKRAVQNALDAGGFVEASRKNKQVGNAAKLREALEYVLHLDATDDAAMEDGLTDGERIAEYADHIEECQKRARAALAAPARNCDKYATHNDAMKAFDAFVREQGKLGFINPYTEAFKWLFAQVTEGGAK